MQSTEKRIGTKIWLSILSVGLAVAIALNVVTLRGQDETEENTIPAIRQEVESINSTLPELEKVGTELKSYITVLETTSGQLQSDLTDIDTALNTLETEVYSRADSEKADVLNQLNDEKAALESEIAAANKELEAAKTANTASEKAITDQITVLEAELEKAGADNKEAIEEKIEALNTELSALIETNTNSVATLQVAAAELEQEITDIDTEIGELKAELDGKISDSERKLLDELNAVKTDAETELESINGAVTTLHAKDDELEQKIADFGTYVNGEITSAEDRANATFATLERFNDIQASVTEINSLIDTTQQSITALETKLSDKIATDIATALAGVDADIAAKVTEITNAYTTAINAACGQTEFTLREAIRTAIDASETSMKQWAYEQMQNGFADLEAKIAESDQKTAKLEGKIAELEEKIAKLECELIGVTDEASLRAAVNRGGTIKLAADISLELSVNIYKEITLNGGDYKITNRNLFCGKGLILTINSGYIEEIYAANEASEAKIFVEGGTIDKILSTDDRFELTINGGNVNSLNFQNGKLIVNGGTIKKITTADHLVDDQICEVTINGGTFNFNPTGFVDTTTHKVINTTDGAGSIVWVVTAK